MIFDQYTLFVDSDRRYENKRKILSFKGQDLTSLMMILGEVMFMSSMQLCMKINIHIVHDNIIVMT